MKIHQEEQFEYIEEGSGPTLLLLHGLFGALSNWEYVINDFKDSYRIIIPLMPIYKRTSVETSVTGLTEFIVQFVEHKKIENCTVMGNSLGGHIALTFALARPDLIDGLLLTGSSGLFESGMGSSFPKRGSYQYIKERVEFTFFAPESATKELVDEVFDIVNDRYSALRVVKIARSAQRHNMKDEVPAIKAPVLLVWGANDNITPPSVAHEFHRLFPNSTLKFIDECGHAPMMEQPVKFNQYLKEFLNTIDNKAL